jgi:hypothetical protein
MMMDGELIKVLGEEGSLSIFTLRDLRRPSKSSGSQSC